MVSRRVSRGLALIEVLVLIAVVLVLLAALVSRLETSRGQAQRQGCIHHLRLLGLGLHNYYATSDVFPMSVVAGAGHGTGQSCFTGLLPWIDHRAEFNAYNFDLENWHPANATVVQSRIAVFVCPTNPPSALLPASRIMTVENRPYPGDSRFAPLHYGANWGGGHPPAWGDDFVEREGRYQGVILPVRTPDGRKFGPDGVPKGRNIRVVDILDGTANTLALVEKRDSAGWGVGGFGGSEFDVDRTPLYQGKDVRARQVYSGSNHPEGVNALFCDGAVRTLSGTLSRAIWYALITRAGGEEISEWERPPIADTGTVRQP